MMSHLHSLSNGLEQLLFRHQSMINAITAGCTAVVVVVSFWIITTVKRQVAISQRAVQIATARLFITDLDDFTDRLGYLCYFALLGHRPRKEDFGVPQDGLSHLLNVLRDTAITRPERPGDDRPVAQFRTRATVARSTELQIVYNRIEDLIDLANNSGYSEMLDGRLMELHVEIGKGTGNIRGPS
jgi:hypothetical protein